MIWITSSIIVRNRSIQNREYHQTTSKIKVEKEDDTWITNIRYIFFHVLLIIHVFHLFLIDRRR